MQLHDDCIEDRGALFQQLLGNHCVLVDVVDICQVAAEGACLHHVPALVALNVAGVPFAHCDLTHPHPAVGL
jgi:hypothetical protein